MSTLKTRGESWHFSLFNCKKTIVQQLEDSMEMKVLGLIFSVSCLYLGVERSTI